MLVTKIIVVLLSAASGVVSSPVAAPAATPDSAEVEKREAQWDRPINMGWRVICPAGRFRAWQGNLVNKDWCQYYCGCRTKFIKVQGICKYEKFLECYHNYCECYQQIGHINP
ncbi:hypothetical protein TWF481_008814 [Arthrobotrys musiformis]|uniref:Uncharacterized protein n=1 Tax=Arthrobotrys musiformis TaxID=47236 RepID=A0AAV9W8A2_9PEZI